MLTGNFVRNVDEKLRIAIPKPFREALDLAPTKLLFVAPGPNGSLKIHTEDGFGRSVAPLAAQPEDPQVRTYAWLLYGQTKQVELDRQGRIRLPAELAKAAGIEPRQEEQLSVVILGVHDHMILWLKSRWEAFLANNVPAYDSIADAAYAPRPQPRKPD